MPQAKNQAQTPVIMQTRNELKTLFADNKTPSGNDFDTFIQSAIIQKDDGFTISPTNVLLDRDITAGEDLTVEGKATLKGGVWSNQLSTLTPGATLNVNAPLLVDGLASLKGGLTLDNTLNMPGRFEVKALEIITHQPLNAQLNINAGKDLTVEGKTTLKGGVWSDQLATATSGATLNVNAPLLVNGLATLKGGLILPEQFTADSTAVTAYQPFTAKDAVKIEKTLTLDSKLDMPGRFEVKPLEIITHQPFNAQLNINAGKDLTVEGKTTLKGGVWSNQLSTLTPDATLNVNAPLLVNGLATLKGGLILPEQFTADSTAVTAYQPFTAKDAVKIEKTLTLDSKLDMPGRFEVNPLEIITHQPFNAQLNINAGKDLTVEGKANLKGGVWSDQLATATSGATLNVNAPLLVSGQSTLKGGLILPEQFTADSTAITAYQPFTAKGTVKIDKTLTLDSKLDMPGRFEVNPLEVIAHQTLNAELNINVGKDLTVKDKTTLKGGLTLPEQFTADSTAITAYQPFTAKDTVKIEKTLTLDSKLDMPGRFEVNPLEIITHQPFNAQLNINAGKDLTVEGKTTLKGGVWSDQLATATSGATLNVNAPLLVDGLATLKGGLTLPEQFTADSTTITAHKPFTAKDTVKIEKTLTLDSKLDMPGRFEVKPLEIIAHQPLNAQLNINAGKDLTVEGKTTLKGGVWSDQLATATSGATLNVNAPLLVDGLATLEGGFSVPEVLTADKERVNVNKPLHITQDKEQAPLKIHDPLRNCTPLMLTAAGDVGINTDAPKAQLHIVAPSGHDALRLEHRAADGSLSSALLITPQGQLALGRSTAEFKLDIAGNARISQELKLDGPLNVSGMATLKGGLTLPGQLEANASSVLIHKPLEIKDNLLVSGSARFDNGLTLPGQFEASAAGVNANKLLSAKNGLIVEGNTTLNGELTLPGQIEAKASGLTLYKPLLVKDSLDISKTLAVTGLSTLNGGLKLPNVLDAGSNGIVLDKELTAKALSKLQGGLSLTQGGAVHRISNNPCLDKDLASDDTLATQLAVKSYVDTYASPFGRGGNTYAIHTQAEFDAVFGNGSGTKVIPKYTTIMILPPRDSHHSHAYTHTDGTSIRPDHEAWKTIIGYELKNAVSLQSGVSILGFNAETTRIVKKHEDCRFLIEGTSAAAVQNIRMEGFTFDGGRMLYQGNGGAVYLNQAKDIVIDAVLIGHQVSGLGGALYGEINVSRVTARNIYACQARNTDTRSGKGGAAFGLRQSEIHASNCFANFGGAIAECHTSQAKASNCQAQLGGAAYQCQKLTLNARDCRAHWHGGGAYECAYLIANGHWEGNRSRYYNTQHIAAHTNSGGFMWRGDFIGNWVDTSWSYQNI